MLSLYDVKLPNMDCTLFLLDLENDKYKKLVGPGNKWGKSANGFSDSLGPMQRFALHRQHCNFHHSKEATVCLAELEGLSSSI